MGEADQNRATDHTRGKHSRMLTAHQWMIVETLVKSRRNTLKAHPLDHRGHPRDELKYLDEYEAILAEIRR